MTLSPPQDCVPIQRLNLTTSAEFCGETGYPAFLTHSSTSLRLEPLGAHCSPRRWNSCFNLCSRQLMTARSIEAIASQPPTTNAPRAIAYLTRRWRVAVLIKAVQRLSQAAAAAYPGIIPKPVAAVRLNELLGGIWCQPLAEEDVCVTYGVVWDGCLFHITHALVETWRLKAM